MKYCDVLSVLPPQARVSGTVAELTLLTHPPESQNVRELTHLLSLGPEVCVPSTAVPSRAISCYVSELLWLQDTS